MTTIPEYANGGIVSGGVIAPAPDGGKELEESIELQDKLKREYSVLMALEKDGWLKSYYELRCNQCHKPATTLMEYFNELPDQFSCEHCGTSQPALENTYLIFKVEKESDVKIEIRMSGIYVDNVNLSDWMQYASDGGKLSLLEYAKQHATMPIQRT